MRGRTDLAALLAVCIAATYPSAAGGQGVTAAATAPTAQAAPATIGAAMARLSRGDPAGAAKIMEEVTAREPTNARAWRTLGLAYHNAGDFDRSIAAFTKSLEVEPGSPVAMYNIGTTYALAGKTEQALSWLQRAKETHRLDMTQLQQDTDVVALRKDKRYAALLPVAADFDKPFVEPVKIIREWDGEETNDQFGWIARDIGDVNGDGVHDIVTSAPTSNKGGASAGRVYVYSTKDGARLWTADGKAADQLGNGIEAAGDVNGDGIPDVVAGAPGGELAMVYSGRDGRVLLTLHGETAQDAFGTHVSGAGDVDGDGHADIIVGAPNYGTPDGVAVGRAYVYSGADGHLLLTLTGSHAGDHLGQTVGAKQSGKGMMLIVGAPGAGDRHTGQTLVYTTLTTTPSFVIDSDSTGAALGAMFVSAVGDVDGDGVADVYASDFSNSAKGPSTGRTYIHSGADGHQLFTLTGEGAGEGFGIGTATAGDVDGDGHDDLIVGSWQYAGAAISGGRAYLYSGKNGQLLRTYTCRTPGDTFGFDAVGIGDVDHDGTTDFLITSAWSGVHGYHSGRMFVISSGVWPAKR